MTWLRSLSGVSLIFFGVACATNPPPQIPLPGDLATIDDAILIADTAVKVHVDIYHATVPPDTLPPDPDPPDPDPPTDPPPPIGETGLAGGKQIWDGFWLGRHPEGVKYGRANGYQWMANNTLAVRKMGQGTRGWFSCEIYYDTEIHPGEGGGQHVIGVQSQTAKQAGPYDPTLDYTNLDGWLRLDFGVRENQINGVIYQDSGDRRTFRTGSYEFRAWKRWAELRVEWEQFDDRIEININGNRSSHAIARGLNPIGNLLSVGNMDTNRGDRCRGDHDPCGLLGKVRYRNFQWGS